MPIRLVYAAPFGPPESESHMTDPHYTARTAHLVVQEIDDEILIYDRRDDTAHCLTAFAAAVWRRCEGGARLSDLVARVTLPTGAGDAEAVVLRALSELSEKGLLDSSDPRVSRRQALGRMAGVGLAAASAPFVVSAAVPTAQAAGSPNTCRHVGESCSPAGTANPNNDCCPDAGAFCSTGGSPQCTACIGSNQATPGGHCTNASLGYQCCSGVCNGSKCA